MANDTTTLDFEDWRYDEWTFTVEGTDYTIQKGGTEVPSGRAEKIVEASQRTEARVQKA